MYLVWINPPTNFTFSDDSVFLKKNLGGGHKFSEFACFISFTCNKNMKLFNPIVHVVSTRFYENWLQTLLTLEILIFQSVK